MKHRISESTWAEIRTAYASGIGLREIARNMDIPAGTVLARAKREGWTAQVKQAKALATVPQSNAITAMQSAAITMAERGERHISRMAGVVDKVLPHVEAMSPATVFERIEKVDRYDRLARRAYGVEQSGGGVPVLNLWFHCGAPPPELDV